MEDNDYVLAFDHFYTTNHIQILKSILPFISNNEAGMLPVLIKYMELNYTLSLINKKTSNFSPGIHACSNTSSQYSEESLENLEHIYNAIHKYLAPDEEKNFNQILSAMKTMKNVREMQQMMELFQSINPDMDLSSTIENLNLNNMNLNNMNFNGLDINDLVNMFGGNNNGNK